MENKNKKITLATTTATTTSLNLVMSVGSKFFDYCSIAADQARQATTSLEKLLTLLCILEVCVCFGGHSFLTAN